MSGLSGVISRETSAAELLLAWAAEDSKVDPEAVRAARQEHLRISPSGQHHQLLLSAGGRRPDGRGSGHQLRAAYLRPGVVSSAVGSAYVELAGGAKVMCSVFGPRQVQQGQLGGVGATGASDTQGALWCEFRYAPNSVAGQSSSGGGGAGAGQTAAEKEAALAITDALSMSVMLARFPKSVIEVYVTVLQADGPGTLGAAITCASLALVDAGIEVYDLVTACRVLHIPAKGPQPEDAMEDDEAKDLASSKVGRGKQVRSASGSSADAAAAPGEGLGVCLVDPTGEEERMCAAAGGGGLLVAYMPALQQVTHLGQNGALSAPQLARLTQLATDGCVQMGRALRQAAIDHELQHQR